MRALLLVMALAAAVPAHADGLDDVVLQGVLRAARDTAPAGAQAAWPGYYLLAQPVLLCRDGGGCLLIGSSSAPAGYSPFRAEGFPEFSVFASSSPPPGLQAVFYLDLPLGGARVFACRYGEGDSPLEVVNTVVHERFHAFQDGKGGTRRAFARLDPAVTPDISEITAENLALAALEEKLLARALLDGRRDAEAVKDFVAVRLQRGELAGRRWTALDNYLERVEGTAEYAAGRIKELGSADGGVFTPAALAAELLKGRADGYSAGHLLRGRQYQTGAAIGLLLDRRASDWKRRVAAGEYPFDILAAEAEVSPAERRSRLNSVKRELDYGQELRYAGYAAESIRAEMAAASADFTAYAGPRLVLGVRYGDDTKVSFTSETTYMINERTELFKDNPLYEFADPAVNLLARDSTLRVYSGEDGKDLIEVLLSSAPAVTAGGRGVSPGPIPEEMFDVSVTAPGVTLTARKAFVQKAGEMVAVDIP